MKKFLSVILCICVLFTACSGMFTAFAASKKALSLSAGIDALREQFEFGESALDYAYYSPVRSKKDDTQYPVVIWLHGMRSGMYSGQQIKLNDIPYWSSSEFQSRFDEGGAYILCPRCPGLPLSMWGEEMVTPLKSTIDDFIEKYSYNIDTSRIYIGGLSMGGKMTVQMASAYPDFFAACFPVAPYCNPTKTELKNMSGTPTWLVASTIDPYVSYSGVLKPAFEYLASVSDTPEEHRMSSISLACYPNGIPVHNMHYVWYAVTYDMFTTNNQPYYYMDTVDGHGNLIVLNYPDGMISWLNEFSTDGDGTASNVNLFSVIGGIIVSVLSYLIKLVL